MPFSFLQTQRLEHLLSWLSSCNLAHAVKATLLGVIMVSGLVVVSEGHAGNLYIFKDNAGNVLLTNVVGRNKRPVGSSFSQYTSKVKVTWYPDTNVHSYRNWGKSEAAVLPSYSRNRNAYNQLIAQASATHGIDQALIKAIMHTESGFNPNARSPVGAQGLMQLMPATARRFSVENAWDPAQNIMGGVRYLKFLMNRFPNRLEHVNAAYNAGEGNVDKYNGIPPFRETQDYVQRVMSRYRNLYAGRALATPTPVTQRDSFTPLNASTTPVSGANGSFTDANYTQSALSAVRLSQ